MFPTARKLDEESGAFLTRRELLAPAEAVIASAVQVDLLSREDRELLEALIAAAKRGDFQGAKAGGRSLGSARNLLLKSSSILAAFYLMGATSSYVAEHSVIVRKAGNVILAAESHVLALFEDRPADIQLALRTLIDRLRKEREQAPDPTIPRSRPHPMPGRHQNEEEKE